MMYQANYKDFYALYRILSDDMLMYCIMMDTNDEK